MSAGRDVLHELTRSEARVLRFVKRFIERNQYPPTRAEIARGMGFASANAAQQHLKALARKGLIHLRPAISRGIRLE